MQVPDILDDLLQTRRNGKAAAVGTLAEEHIEIADAVLVAPLKVAVAHGQLIEVAEHGEIEFFAGSHKKHLIFVNYRYYTIFRRK